LDLGDTLEFSRGLILPKAIAIAPNPCVAISLRLYLNSLTFQIEKLEKTILGQLQSSE
jgi:hypothetical protein